MCDVSTAECGIFVPKKQRMKESISPDLANVEGRTTRGVLLTRQKLRGEGQGGCSLPCKR